MQITAEIRKYHWNGYCREYLGTSIELVEVEQVADWRKGLCLCKKESQGSWNQKTHKHLKSYRIFLVNSELKAVFYHDSDSYWELMNLESLPMERSFGGFYVTYEGKCQVLATYPGQDRDTEYRYYQTICNIITEDGIILQDDEKKEFLSTHKIRSCRELLNGRVLADNSLYCLEDYSLIKELSKKINIIGNFENGVVRAEVLDDICNLYVIVQNKRIVRYFKEQDFIDISEILNADLTPIKPKQRLQIKPDNIDAKIATTNYKTVIKDYLYEINPKYNTRLNNFDSILAINHVRHYIDYTGYFEEKGQWYKIDYEELKQTFIKMIETHYPIKNFITNIYPIGKIKFNDKSAILYCFKCHPFGYLDINGNLIYDFNLNDIKWY